MWQDPFICQGFDRLHQELILQKSSTLQTSSSISRIFFRIFTFPDSWFLLSMSNLDYWCLHKIICLCHYFIFWTDLFGYLQSWNCWKLCKNIINMLPISTFFLLQLKTILHGKNPNTYTHDYTVNNCSQLDKW